MTKASVKQEFGAAVRAQRLRLGISQELLAERAALHRTYITDVERGARNLSLDSISRLARALDLSVSSLFPSPQSARFDRRSAPAHESKGVDILLVEDDPRDIELTLQAFADARLSNRVEVVRDGAAALDRLLGNRSSDRRDQAANALIVLLDLDLPKLHGLEVLKRLQAEKRKPTMQIVVLTSSRRDADLREAMRLGAEAYIVKPLDFHAFISITPHLNFSWTLLNPPPGSAPASGWPKTSLNI
jgi:CheY-like chemotaxis protein